MTRGDKRRGPREGSIFQRKDGRWCSAVHLGYDPHTGKRRRQYVYAASYEEVLAKRNDLQERHRRGEPTRYERQTVGAYMQQWLEAVEPDLRPSTFTKYDSLTRNHILPSVGKVQLADLNQAHVLSLLRSARSKLAPVTVTDVYTLLNQAVGQAVKWGLCQRNVVALVDRPRFEHKEMKVLTASEIGRLLDAVRGTPYEALYTLAAMLGLRKGELLALRWKEDVDLERSQLSVRQTLQRLRGDLVFGPPKSKSSRRTIRLPEACVSALRAHRRAQIDDMERELGEGKGHRSRWLVFCTGEGTPLDPRNLDRQFKAALRRADLPDVRFHDLRHTAASLMISQKVEAKLVSEILGHASIGVTLNLYAHLYEAQRQEAADAMDRLFGTL